MTVEALNNETNAEEQNGQVNGKLKEYIEGLFSSFRKSFETKENKSQTQGSSEGQGNNNNNNNTDSGSVTTIEKDPIQARLEKLEKESQEQKATIRRKEAEEANLRFEKAIDQCLGSNVLHRETVKELLVNRFRTGAKENVDTWILKDGDSLQEAVNKFMQTDAGKHFTSSTLPSGTGTPTPGSVRGGSNSNLPKLSDAEFVKAMLS